MIKVVDYYATWCGPCKMMDPVIHELEEEYTDKVEFEKVDVDQDTQRAATNNVMSIPTYQIVKDGNVVDTFIGYTAKEEFKKKIDAQLS